MLASLLTLFGAVSKAAACDKSGGFLGLHPWYYYLPDSYFKGCEVVKFNFIHGGSDIPLVLLAIVDDLLRIAGFVAVVFVFIGGVKYMTSQGNPEDTSKAQSTVINALIGLAVAVVAVGFVSFIGNELGNKGGTPLACSGASTSVLKPCGLPKAAPNKDTVADVFGIARNIIGALCLLIITVSGLRYVTSAGEPQKASQAKNGIVYALIGLVIVLTAQVIVAFVTNRAG